MTFKRALIRLMSLAGAFTLTLIAGCASQPSYYIDHNDSVDFSSFKTYRWYDDVHPSKEADYRKYNSSDKRVRTYVDSELADKGFVERSAGPTDFWMNYHVSKQDHMKIDNFSGYPQGMHGSVGAGTYGSAVSIGYSSGPAVRTYREGTVVLDVIDTTDNKIVWRGVAEGRLQKSLTPSEKNRIAAEVSRELLAEFPPGVAR